MVSSSSALEMCMATKQRQQQQQHVHDPLATTTTNNAREESSSSSAAALKVQDAHDNNGDDTRLIMGTRRDHHLGGGDGGGGGGGEDEGMIRSSSNSHSSHVGHANVVLQETTTSNATLRNFYIMSILFSTVPAAALACLSLATARLGLIGAWQSGILYLAYCLSALFGATYIVKRLGSRNALVLGMSLYCLYVTCFWLAALYPFMVEQQGGLILTMGAGLGGLGAGIMWTAQGTYFAQAAHAYALETPGMDGTNTAPAASNSKLAGIFAFCLLVEETTFDLLSTLLIRIFGISWTFIFGLYTFLAVSATILLQIMVKEYPQQHGDHDDDDDDDDTNDDIIAGSSAGGGGVSWNDVFYKATCAFNLLVNDSKMKYMIGFNAAFGFCGAFLNSFVSGQVVPVALRDANASYVGLFVAVHGTVAAMSSLLFAHLAPKIGNGPILSLGAVAFAAVAFPFLIQPNLEQWTWTMLLFIYSAEGVGRATFESTLKAVFADFFYYEKEGAFANIILQNGIASSIAYVMSFRLTCNDTTGSSKVAGTNGYCIEYRDGSHHDVFAFGMMVMLTSIAAILGYWRAFQLFQAEMVQHDQSRHDHTPLTHQTRSIYFNLNYSHSHNRNSSTSPNTNSDDDVVVGWDATPEIEENDSSHLPQIA